MTNNRLIEIANLLTSDEFENSDRKKIATELLEISEKTDIENKDEMTVNELIQYLKQMNPEAKVKIDQDSDFFLKIEEENGKIFRLTF